MRAQTAASIAAAFALAGLLAGGCAVKASYPKAQLAETLQRFLSQEGLNASVRVMDHTVAIKIAYPGAIVHTNNQVEPGPGFDDVMHKSLTQLHRVLLSTDADMRFYVLLIADPQSPGAYLTLVRYMDDIRRANASMLDTPEIFARTILEPNLMGTEPLDIETYVPRDIRLEEFLSWQLARRIQFALAQEFQVSGIADVGRCSGEFKDGEFAFLLDMVPPPNHKLDDATMQQAFQTSTQVISKVLSSYQFDAFKSIRLIHPPTGRNIVLPKTSLAVFR